MLQKKRNIHTEDTTSHGEKQKEQKKRKKKEVPRIELANFELDSLMVSPPTLQRHELLIAEPFTLLFCTPPHFCRRHELAKSIHATFLYPTARHPPLFDAVVVCRCSGGDYRWVVPVLVHSFTDYDTYRLVYVNIEPSNTDTSVRATSTE